MRAGDEPALPLRGMGAFGLALPMPIFIWIWLHFAIGFAMACNLPSGLQGRIEVLETEVKALQTWQRKQQDIPLLFWLAGHNLEAARLALAEFAWRLDCKSTQCCRARVVGRDGASGTQTSHCLPLRSSLQSTHCFSATEHVNVVRVAQQRGMECQLRACQRRPRPRGSVASVVACSDRARSVSSHGTSSAYSAPSTAPPCIECGSRSCRANLVAP